MKRIIAFAFCLLSTTWILSGQWVQLNDTPFETHHSNGFGYNGKAYVIEGSPNTAGGSGPSNMLWEYAPDLDEWKQIADCPGPGRTIAIGDDMDGKYYYGFGNDSDGALSDVWVFDPIDTSFTELPSCPGIGRSHPAFVAHNNKIFMGSGSSYQGDLNDWWELDLTSGLWTQKDNIPGQVRHHPFQFGIDNAIYVGGGHISNWAKYDIETSTWSAINDLPGGRVAGTQFSHNGKGYVLSGDDENHGPIISSQLFLQYSPEEDLWRELPPHPGTNKWACSSFIIDDFLYLFGGLEYDETEYGNASTFRFNLSKLNCLSPTGLLALNVTDVSAGLFWSSNTAGSTDTLKYRKVGIDQWTVIENAQAVYDLDNLEACQEYEFTIVTDCDSLVSDYAPIYQFTTDGCCLNPDLHVADLTETTASINWEGILAASEYEIRWSKYEEQDWETSNTAFLDFQLSDLEACTEYEIQVRTLCVNEETPFSESLIFRTRGCGVCIDQTYCEANESYTGDLFYIDEIELNGYVNSTGNNEGYGNFEDPDAIELTIGNQYDLSLTLGYEFDPFGVNYSVWIDLDSDAEFSNNEKLLYVEFADNEYTGELNIPDNAVAGLTKMRIIAGWDDNINPCEENEFYVGEVEDYCVTLNVQSSVSQSSPEGYLEVAPNPFKDYLSVRYGNATSSKLDKLVLTDILGTKLISKDLNQYQFGENQVQLNTSQLKQGIYIISLIDKSGDLVRQQKVIRMN